jgi:hypothetical protein
MVLTPQGQQPGQECCALCGKLSKSQHGHDGRRNPLLQGLQRQIALVAKLLRDEVDPVTLDALQNRQASYAPGVACQLL